MMNHKQYIGMDIWKCTISLPHVLQIAKQRGWSIYEIKQKDTTVVFYTSILNHTEIWKSFEHIEHVKTTGMLGFLFRQMRQPRRVLCLFISIAIWYGLSNTVFAIELQGDKQETKDTLQLALNELGYTTPFYNQNIQEMKVALKKHLENDIAWLEVSSEGSRFHIQFTTKEFAHIDTLKQDELIAQKDGVIARFDLQHGAKMVALNQLVHKGDVLVSNILLDSANSPQDVFVKGKVFAYTWKEVRVEMPQNDLPKAFQFFQLLFQARSEAAKGLGENENITKENILQFRDNTGTISMDIHYTLLEDITTP